MQSLKCRERQRKRVLSCLDVQYLRRLLLVGKSRPWLKDPVNKNYRYHFRAQIAHILGWREKHKFPEHIDELIREQLWPEDVITDDCEGGQQVGCGSQTRGTQRRNTTPSEKEDRRTEEENRDRGRERSTGYTDVNVDVTANDGGANARRHTNSVREPGVELAKDEGPRKKARTRLGSPSVALLR